MIFDWRRWPIQIASNDQWESRRVLGFRSSRFLSLDRLVIALDGQFLPSLLGSLTKQAARGCLFVGIDSAATSLYRAEEYVLGRNSERYEQHR
jgi:hypothetical protein